MSSTSYKRLMDVWPNALTTGGIFTELSTRDIPWKDTIYPLTLDLEYYGNRSGNKVTSRLLDRLLDMALTLDETTKSLADIIVALYLKNWVKLYDTYNLQYNPIENYSMQEVMTNDIKTIEYGSKSVRTDDLSKTETPNTTEILTNDLSDNTNMGVYGFDSSDPVNSDTTDISRTGTQETKTTGSNITSDTGTQSIDKSGEDTETRNYTLSRSGNIGVTTSQQMLESERNLWQWDFFNTVVFPDVDRVLTIPIY